MFCMWFSRYEALSAARAFWKLAYKNAMYAESILCRRSSEEALLPSLSRNTKCSDWRYKVEMERFELLTPCLQGRCSPNLATPPLIRHPPVLPHRHQCSTFGRLGLNRRVRDGNGCDPQMYRHRKLITLSLSDDGQELIESLLSYEIMTGIIEGEAFMRNPKDSECAQGFFL